MLSLCHVFSVDIAGMVEYVKKSETGKNEGLHRILNRLVDGISNITDTNFEPRLVLRCFRYNQVQRKDTLTQRSCQFCCRDPVYTIHIHTLHSHHHCNARFQLE